MPDIDDILKISTPAEFELAAMEVFRRQATDCPPYREYLDAIGIDPAEVGSAEEIPFLPIELFKTHRVYCDGGAGGHGRPGIGEPEAVFTSSGTSASKHYVARLADYEKTYTKCFELFYGDPRDWNIRALLPSYVERGGSSLVYMVEGLQKTGREEGRSGEIKRELLLGVSYALLDLAETLTQRGEKLPPGTVVMETGGMKGRREEISKSKMHGILQQAFGVSEIHSEYGMAELTSQAYSSGRGIFRTPPWMRIAVRDLGDPFDVRHGGQGEYGGRELRGGINIIDLANLNSCAFIQTQDIGTLAADGSFTIDGRVARSDIRGCNLLVQ